MKKMQEIKTIAIHERSRQKKSPKTKGEFSLVFRLFLPCYITLVSTIIAATTATAI